MALTGKLFEDRPCLWHEPGQGSHLGLPRENMPHWTAPIGGLEPVHDGLHRGTYLLWVGVPSLDDVHGKGMCGEYDDCIVTRRTLRKSLETHLYTASQRLNVRGLSGPSIDDAPFEFLLCAKSFELTPQVIHAAACRGAAPLRVLGKCNCSLHTVSSHLFNHILRERGGVSECRVGLMRSGFGPHPVEVLYHRFALHLRPVSNRALAPYLFILLLRFI